MRTVSWPAPGSGSARERARRLSTLINPTWWLLCAAFAVCAAARDPHRALRAGLQWVTWTPVLVVIAGATAANLGGRAMLGHAVPGDFAQEVVAARSLRARTPLYPPDVNARVEEWLAAHPPVVPDWLPPPAKRWLDGRQRYGRNRLVAQAHPPTLLLAASPFILGLGGYGAYWALTILSVAAAALTAGVLVDAFAPAASRRERVLAALVLLSWQPVLATIRDGQVSVLIGTLLVLAWADLRRGRDARAGLAIGVAGALKLYPLMMLVLLALRRRHAFASACVVLAGAAAATFAIAGPDAWTQYAGSARMIAGAFVTAPYNLSLLPRLAAVVPAPLMLAAWTAASAMLVGVTLLAVDGSKVAEGRLGPSDVECAAFLTLALLLSPVAWHHYAFMLALPLVVVGMAAWTVGGRAALACASGLAIVLSVPDDAWRWMWRQIPAGPAMAVSPGLAVLLLWAALLHARPGAIRQPAAAERVPAGPPAACRQRRP
jgi:hypothetical protein